MPSPRVTHPAFYHDNARAARQYAAKIARNTRRVDVELVCKCCLETFIWRATEEGLTKKVGAGRREYCDKCRLPAARRRRAVRKEAQC